MNNSLTERMVKNKKTQKMCEENVAIGTKMLEQRLLSETISLNFERNNHFESHEKHECFDKRRKL